MTGKAGRPGCYFGKKGGRKGRHRLRLRRSRYHSLIRLHIAGYQVQDLTHTHTRRCRRRPCSRRRESPGSNNRTETISGPPPPRRDQAVDYGPGEVEGYLAPAKNDTAPRPTQSGEALRSSWLKASPPRRRFSAATHTDARRLPPPSTVPSSEGASTPPSGSVRATSPGECDTSASPPPTTLLASSWPT